MPIFNVTAVDVTKLYKVYQVEASDAAEAKEFVETDYTHNYLVDEYYGDGYYEVLDVALVEDDEKEGQ